MKLFAETEHYLLREIQPEDVQGIFELDSDPEVHLFLGNRPITTMQQAEEAIHLIQDQYQDNGIGRWAIVEKASGEFVGWSGLKFVKEEINGHQQFYDLGYRIKKKFWGRGIATQTGLFAIEYAFRELKVRQLFARAVVENQASNRVLTKVGFRFVNSFDYMGWRHNWYELSESESPSGSI